MRLSVQLVAYTSIPMYRSMRVLRGGELVLTLNLYPGGTPSCRARLCADAQRSPQAHDARSDAPTQPPPAGTATGLFNARCEHHHRMMLSLPVTRSSRLDRATPRRPRTIVFPRSFPRAAPPPDPRASRPSPGRRHGSLAAAPSNTAGIPNGLVHVRGLRRRHGGLGHDAPMDVRSSSRRAPTSRNFGLRL